MHWSLLAQRFDPYVRPDSDRRAMFGHSHLGLPDDTAMHQAMPRQFAVSLDWLFQSELKPGCQKLQIDQLRRDDDNLSQISGGKRPPVEILRATLPSKLTTMTHFETRRMQLAAEKWEAGPVVTVTRQLE